MLLHDRAAVVGLEGETWRVRTPVGGSNPVDLAEESCTCPDYEYPGRKSGVPCKHVFAVAIAHATRRGQRTPRTVSVGPAGDPIAHAAARRRGISDLRERAGFAGREAAFADHAGEPAAWSGTRGRDKQPFAVDSAHQPVAPGATSSRVGGFFMRDPGSLCGTATRCGGGSGRRGA